LNKSIPDGAFIFFRTLIDESNTLKLLNEDAKQKIVYKLIYN
jgi:hypothetical protein